MFIFDMTNPLTLFLVLIATILFIYLSQEIKRSMVAAIPLFAFLISLVIHTIQVLTLQEEFSYLWADEVEAREFNKKSVDDGLKWLWKKV